jgi:hypothetical protein
VFGTRQPLEPRINRRDGTAHYTVRALPYSNSRTCARAHGKQTEQDSASESL